MQSAELLGLPLAIPNGGSSAAAPFQPPAWVRDHFAAESQQVAQDFRLEHAPSVFLPGGMADLQELDQSSLAEADLGSPTSRQKASPPRLEHRHSPARPW